MKMSGIQAKDLIIGDSVAQIKFVRADPVAFRANSEQLGFNRVAIMPVINLL